MKKSKNGASKLPVSSVQNLSRAKCLFNSMATLPAGIDGKSGELDSIGDDQLYIYMNVPPDGGYGWLVVLASFLCNATVDGIAFTIGRHLPGIAEEFNLDMGRATLISAVQFSMYYFVGPFVSAIVNRVGFRIVTMTGSVICGVSILSASYSPTYELILFLYGVCAGIGFGMIYSPSTIIVGYYFEKYRAIATSISVCGSSVGILTIPILIKYLLPDATWRIDFKVQTGMCLSLFFIAMLYRQPKPVKLVRVDDAITKVDGISKSSSSDESVEINSARYSNILASINESILEGTTENTPAISVHIQKNETCTSKCRDFCNKFFCYNRAYCKKDIPQEGHFFIKNRPLFRDDIFFHGSLKSLPHYTKSMDVSEPIVRAMQGKDHPLTHSANYTLAVTRIPSEIKLTKWCVFHIDFMATIRKGLNLLFDPEILNRASFLLCMAAAFFSTLGTNVPYLLIASRAQSYGIREDYKNFLIPLIGTGNTIFRILAGLIALIPTVNIAYLVASANITAGILTLISVFVGLKVDEIQMLYCFTFGSLIAFSTSLRSIIYVKFFGLDKLTNTFGISCVFMGLSSMIATPIAGLLREITGNFQASFIYASCALILAGTLQFFASIINRRENMIAEQKKRVIFVDAK